ncbi:hypothetical protein [Lacibacter sp. H407]|uniref:hypothetical protein n=1 Tax=Lacibacter sp. H407 TaxID=3133423 RepID=UPI0030BE932A
MKKSLLLFTLLISSVAVFAQYEEEEKEKGFKRDQLFIGSGINLGFFNGFILGLNPEVGYSLNRFVDVGVGVNVNYITQNEINAPITYRQFVIGGGPFVRVWPVNMIFLGGQFEFNRIAFSVKDNGTVMGRTNYTAPSILVGGGYGNRLIGRSQFYTSIMVDVLRDPKSPYIDQFNRLQPVFRTTFLFYLKPKRER